MKNFTIILFLLLASVSFAQKSPINFETDGNGATWTWNVFENSTNPPLEIINNPDPSGINTSSKVAKFTALQAGQPWAGVESKQGIDLGTFSWNANNRIVKIMVWKSVKSDVGIKFDTETGWAQVELKKANTLVNQWEELTFDFSSYLNPPGGSGSLGRIIIFPDFNLAGRTQNNIAYFDNITFSASGVPADGPSAAAPTPPIRAAADVISVFSNAYTNVTGTDFNPGWGQSTIVSTVEIAGNQTLKYAGLNYQGTQFAPALNVTAMAKLHIDMWTANATSVNIFCISTGPVEKAYTLAITPNQWVSYDIPLTAFANVNLADVIQFKFEGNDAKPTIYLDNLYFYKDGAVPVEGPKAPINFEATGYGANWTWGVFENGTNPPLEIINNPDATGINTSAKVAKFTALQAGQPWAGVESAHGTTDLGPFVLGATNSTIKIMVWKSVISDVGIKLVANSNWAQAEKKVANTKVNQWEELTFDFSSYPNPPQSEGKYDRIVIFPDFNTAGRTQNNVVYFDNITFNPAGTPTDAPTAAAPTPPARAAANVISVFSNAYTNVTGTDFNPGWGQSTIVSTVEIAGNQTLKYAGLNYQGTQFAPALNVSAMEKLHVDMWTANATSVNIFCISTGPVEKAYALAVTPNQWVSYDIPLTAFANVNLSDVIQFKFEGNDAKPTIYLDNLYFYKVPSSISTLKQNDLHLYPNPVKSGYPVHLGSVASQVDVFDLTGKRIHSIRNTSSLKTEGLKQGVYFIRIQSNKGAIQTNKLVIN